MTQYVVLEDGWEYNDETYDKVGNNPKKIFADEKSAKEHALNLTIDRIKNMDGDELRTYNNWNPVIDIDKYREIMGINKNKIGPLKMMMVLGDEDPDDLDNIGKLPKEREKLVEFIKNMKVQFYDVVKVD